MTALENGHRTTTSFTKARQSGPIRVEVGFRRHSEWIIKLDAPLYDLLCRPTLLSMSSSNKKSLNFPVLVDPRTGKLVISNERCRTPCALFFVTYKCLLSCSAGCSSFSFSLSFCNNDPKFTSVLGLGTTGLSFTAMTGNLEDDFWKSVQHLF